MKKQDKIDAVMRLAQYACDSAFLEADALGEEDQKKHKEAGAAATRAIRAKLEEIIEDDK